MKPGLVAIGTVLSEICFGLAHDPVRLSDQRVV